MSIHNPGFPLLSQIGANSFRIFLASHHLTRLLLCIAMFGQPDLMKIVDIPNQASIPTPKSQTQQAGCTTSIQRTIVEMEHQEKPGADFPHLESSSEARQMKQLLSTRYGVYQMSRIDFVQWKALRYVCWPYGNFNCVIHYSLIRTFCTIFKMKWGFKWDIAREDNEYLFSTSPCVGNVMGLRTHVGWCYGWLQVWLRDVSLQPSLNPYPWHGFDGSRTGWWAFQHLPVSVIESHTATQYPWHGFLLPPPSLPVTHLTPNCSQPRFCGHGSWVYKNPWVPQPAWGYAFRDDQWTSQGQWKCQWTLLCSLARIGKSLILGTGLLWVDGQFYGTSGGFMGVFMGS